jgi:ABC-type nitrate/sulfonate/bicarbonate transport system permease component
MMSRRRLPGWSYGALGVLGALAVMEALSHVTSGERVPSASATLRTLARDLASTSFWSDLGATLEAWGLGLVVASSLAVPLGILVGSRRLLYRALRAPIEFLRPIPSVALIPLVILALGSGLRGKVFLVAFASFWPVFVQTLYGVQDVDPLARDTARAFGIGGIHRFLGVTLPGSAPYVATGLRLASSTALVVAVAAELLIGGDGLGRSIALAEQSGAADLTYGRVAAAGLVGWALNSVFVEAERRLLPWRVEHRPVG